MSVNLEKKLIKENKKIFIPSELLLVNNFENQATLENDNTLSRIGLNTVLKEGGKLKRTKDDNKEQTLSFNQERVFHISQIKGICQKYFLRFLPSHLYQGAIDNELPSKIASFEIAHTVICQASEPPTWNGTDVSNTFVMAPLQSFKLKQRPKDPLLFYKINEEYYYLIHKWGNDMSSFRRLLGLLSSTILSTALLLAFVTGLIVFEKKHLIATAFIPVIVFTCAMSFVVLLITGITRDGFRFVNRNNWNSQYKN